MSEPVRRTDGSVDLTRLMDGRVMCCICFGYFARVDLYHDESGQPWDMCVPCGNKEGTP